MENRNHRLGMTVLELQDTVAGHPDLTKQAITKLMAAEDFSILTPDLQQRVLGQMIPTSSWLVAEVGGAAVLITNQWVVSIHGNNLDHCVAVLVKYRNAIATQLDATVTGDLKTPVVENTGPLGKLVSNREEQTDRKTRLDGIKKQVFWTFVQVATGAVVTILLMLFLGG